MQDPKRRLHHLLGLEGRAPSTADQTVPRELHDLFPAIGALAQRANLFRETMKAASNALSRSLLKPQLLELQKETAELREKIQALSDDCAGSATGRLIRAGRTNPSGDILRRFPNLYFTFAYLGRWSAQLDEIAFQLSLH